MRCLGSAAELIHPHFRFWFSALRQRVLVLLDAIFFGLVCLRSCFLLVCAAFIWSLCVVVWAWCPQSRCPLLTPIRSGFENVDAPQGCVVLFEHCVQDLETGTPLWLVQWSDLE